MISFLYFALEREKFSTHNQILITLEMLLILK